jgi:hypothetical protein
MSEVWPCLTYSGPVDENSPIHPVGVVFSFEQAAYAVNNYFGQITLICVDIPRSRHCVTLAAAREFFMESA